MITRFKNVILNAVSNSGVDGHNQNSIVNGTPSGSSGISNIVNGSRRSSGRLSHNIGDNLGQHTPKKPVKHQYSRPHFLNLSSPDEIQVSADHAVRPIIVPRDLSSLPWNTGYAETINSGKSKKNEDQARVHVSVLKIPIVQENSNGNEKTDNFVQEYENTFDIPYRYFGVFDGHAGPGAAVAAATQLHLIVHERLMEIGRHLIPEETFCEGVGGKGKSSFGTKGVMWFPTQSITNDSLIVGALEAAFHQMDAVIEDDHKLYDGVNGGCTAVVCLFIFGKIFIANAGDSRAILCRRNFDALALSEDFTPETERPRVRQMAAENPNLLGGEFTSLEFVRRPTKRDIGTKILYRGAHMTGWAYKTATEGDLRFPVVFGTGKRSRVLATIGVTRGFGDHDLCAQGSSVRIKPFLSSQPQVRIIDLKETVFGEDDVIVMGTDGLWDVTGNDTVASIVFSTVDQFPSSIPDRFKYRYCSAAQDLVMHARGKFNERNWKMSDGSPATIDDISVFVIPLWPYKTEIEIEEKSKNKVQTSIETPSDFFDTINGNVSPLDESAEAIILSSPTEILNVQSESKPSEFNEAASSLVLKLEDQPGH